MGGRQRGRPGEDDAEGVHGGFFRARYKGNRRVFRQGVKPAWAPDVRPRKACPQAYQQDRPFVLAL